MTKRTRLLRGVVTVNHTTGRSAAQESVDSVSATRGLRPYYTGRHRPTRRRPTLWAMLATWPAVFRVAR